MWLELFDERQRDEIRFNKVYLNDFRHGTDGHNIRIIVAKMSHILDGLCEDSSVREHIQRQIVRKKIDDDEK